MKLPSLRGPRVRTLVTQLQLVDTLVSCQVGEMVRDAISRNLLAFRNMLQSYDLGGTGLVGANSFKKVMHTFCPCLTAGHLTQ